jgi:tetratricopeptide (TPR) repeat protein
MYNHINRYVILVIWIFILIPSFSIAQESSKILDKEEQKQILEKTSWLLTNNYVNKDAAKACVEFLREQIDARTYKNTTHPRAFARQLTTDLRKIHKDRHIRVQSIAPEDKKLEEENPILNFLLHTRDRIKDNLGLREVKILPGNIGYIDIRSFEPLDLVRKKVLNTLHFLEDTDALIIDLRNNHGGNPTTVQFICSAFFDKPVHLNSIYWRRGDYTEQFWTINNIEIRKRARVPIFILISSSTFSGGEEFAYNLKAYKRATLIGEKTAGGANPGYSFSINDRFNIFIPTGRSTNPVTGTNWEDSGVEPDIQTKATNALIIATEKAEKAARIYREKSDDEAVQSYLELSTHLEIGSKLFSQNLEDSAQAIINSALEQRLDAGLLSEWSVNALGYKYMAKNDMSVAITLFKFNVYHYSESANAYDSLGEAYMKMGKNDLAIQNYKKSLSLDPQNQNAKQMLDNIDVKVDNTP